MHVAILHNGVDHQRDVIILHTDFQNLVDVRMVTASKEGGLFNELNYLITMTILLLKP